MCHLTFDVKIYSSFNYIKKVLKSRKNAFSLAKFSHTWQQSWNLEVLTRHLSAEQSSL